MNTIAHVDLTRRILRLALAASMSLPIAPALAASANQQEYLKSRPVPDSTSVIDKIKSAMSSADPSRNPFVQWFLIANQILTLVLLLKTAEANQKSANATAATVREMQEAREKASAPHVVVYLLSPDTSIVEVIVENFGEGTARNVAFRIDPPLQSSTFENVGKFFETTKWLPPRSRLTFALDVWSSYFEAGLPRQYTFKVDYRDASNGKDLTGEFVLDLDSFRYLASWKKVGMPELVKTVEKLAESQKLEARAIASGLKLIEAGFPWTRESGSLEEAMATIRGVHDVICSGNGREGVLLPWKLLFSRLRLAIIAAIVYVDMNQDEMPELRSGLLEALVQLFHYRAWEAMMEDGQSKKLKESIASLLMLFYANCVSTKGHGSEE
jgi:hypothetical protein